MSITVIVFIVLAILAIGIKVRRGSFFWWTSQKDTPNSRGNGSGGNDDLR